MGIGTQAAVALHTYLGNRLSDSNLLFLGVTDPVGAKLVESFSNRSDQQNVAVVAYMGRPEDYANRIYTLFPGQKFTYIYQQGFPQDEVIASRLAATDAASRGKLLIRRLDRIPQLSDFSERDRIYFSWYTFEKMFESGRSLDVLRQRIVVTSTKDNVEQDNMAAVGVSVSDSEIGQFGVALLMDDLRKTKPLRNTEVVVPQLHYWINCHNAERLGLVLTRDVISAADEAFDCSQ